MKENSKIFKGIVERRKSYRVFDPDYKVTDEVIEQCLKNAILSPNSSNMQLWEFYVISKHEDIQTVGNICLNQNGAKTASQIVIFVARPDKWKDRQKSIVAHLDTIYDDRTTKEAKKAYSYYIKVLPILFESSFLFIRNPIKRLISLYNGSKKPFYREVHSNDLQIVAQKSVALAAQTFMLSVSAEGLDCLPMEGLDSIRMKTFLKLPKGAKINMAVAVGKGKPEGIYGPRFRIPYNEVVFKV
ncbi:MAG: nitroreductase [Planctomycetota bacterium]|jgi:nitroreductase